MVALGPATKAKRWQAGKLPRSKTLTDVRRLSWRIRFARCSRISLHAERFHGHSECTPIYWLDQAFRPGAEAALRGRGGLPAQIVSDACLGISGALDEI